MQSRIAIQPIEIWVNASIGNPVAIVRWQFVRMTVLHKFEMSVVQDEKDRSIAIRDNSFTMSYPLTYRQREEHRRKHRGLEVPTSHVKKIPTIITAYRDMVASVRKLLRDRPLIDDARTSPTGFVVVRYPEFIYPAWYRKRDYGAYDPRAERATEVTLSLPSPVTNGVDATSPLAAIVQAHTPVPLPKSYADGISDTVAVIEKMALELHTMAETQTLPEGKAIFQGYAAMLTEAKGRVTKLLD